LRAVKYHFVAFLVLQQRLTLSVQTEAEVAAAAGVRMAAESNTMQFAVFSCIFLSQNTRTQACIGLHGRKSAPDCRLGHVGHNTKLLGSHRHRLGWTLRAVVSPPYTNIKEGRCVFDIAQGAREQ
jgi:hypothetical protein